MKIAAYAPGYLKTTQANVTDGLAVPSITSAKNVKSKKIKIKFGAVSGADGYELQYALNKKFTKSKKTKKLGAQATSCTLKKLKKGKTFFIRIRCYSNEGGDKNYSPWSSIKKVKIKK